MFAAARSRLGTVHILVNNAGIQSGARFQDMTLAQWRRVLAVAQEFAAERIRVNAVAPGAIRTPINRAAWDQPEAMAGLLNLIPYGRIGEPLDVASALLFLASDLSDYVTGTTLFVDGGMSLFPSFRGAG